MDRTHDFRSIVTYPGLQNMAIESTFQQRSQELKKEFEELKREENSKDRLIEVQRNVVPLFLI